MHDLLRISELEAGEFTEILETSVAAKKDPDAVQGAAKGKIVGVLFEKPSLRTRFSVEAALARLGAYPIGAYDREVGLSTREPIDDAAEVLARYVDAIVLRTFGHERVVELAEHADVPVVNALSDAHHPLQGLADLLTVAEAKCGGDVRALKSVKLGWVGDGNNVLHSLIEGCALAGADISAACPVGYEPDGAIVEWARERGISVDITNDPVAATAGVDVVSTDVWASMGQEDEAAKRRAVFEPFRVTGELMSNAAPGAVFLHCLPAHRGEEVDAEVIDGPASRVFDQAENRLHTTLAVFLHAWGLR